MPEDQAASGYRHPDYARSLDEFGAPLHLPQCDGWLLQRSIAGGAGRDAMGCYPLFACRDWSRLHLDLETMADQLVSLVLVADPFGASDLARLRQCFPDRFAPLKDHFTVDLGRPLDEIVHAHHQRNARKALSSLMVERITEPSTLLDEWTRLYANLVERHGIRGLSAFSDTSFARQFRVPGLTVFCARRGDEVVGMNLWFEHDSVGYYHLGAYSDVGYDLRASFALFLRALEHFASAGLTALNLGAGAGLTNDASDGLSRFKRGWATGTRTAYLCGRIFDAERYARLADGRGQDDYFPAYRKGEFN